MSTEETSKKELIDKITQSLNESSMEDVQKVANICFYEVKFGLKPKSQVWKSIIGKKFFLIAGLLTIVSIALVSKLFAFGNQKIADLVIYSLWIIVPPSWFLYEYTVLFPDNLKLDSVHLTDLKYTQELAGKIWAAVVVLISAILYHKYAG